MTIDQLSARLGVPRSTIYKWVSDIRLPNSGPGGGFTPEARRRGNRAMRESRRRQRECYYMFGLETYANLSAEPTFRDFLVSYVALGKKSDRREVSFSHPDPLMMRLAGRWLLAYGRNRLRYQLVLPPDADIERARKYWSERLDVPPEEIQLAPSDGESAPGHSKYGVLGTLRIASTDTLLRVELQAWTDCARSEWRQLAQTSPAITRGAPSP